MCCLFCLMFFPASQAHAWPGVVESVQDGDTVTVLPAGAVDASVGVRLYGIDAPETDQTFGGESAAMLRLLVPLGSRVEIVPMGADRYGRMTAVVILDGMTVNYEMVKQGGAWVEPRYCRAKMCRRWWKGVREAQDEGRGLWAQGAKEPWKWRAEDKKSRRKADTR